MVRLRSLLLLPVVSLLVAAEPPRDDSLPAGALARLGSVVWRPGGYVSHLMFSSDGKRLFS
jgi:hypothetical protein